MIKTRSLATLIILTVVTLCAVVVPARSAVVHQAPYSLSASVRHEAATAAYGVRAQVPATAPQTRSLPYNCKAMLPVPGYSIKVNATETFRIPSGASMVRAAIKSSGHSLRDLKIQCERLVINYGADLVFASEHPGAMRVRTTR